MHTAATDPLTPAVLRSHLEQLERERSLAALTGLSEVAAYRRDLEAELAVTRAAYVGAAVTEIASLRGLLGGRLQG